MLRLFRFFVLTLLYSFRGDFRYFYYLKYKKNYRMGRPAILRYQNERLKKQLRYCYGNIPYYRNIFQKLGLEPEDLNDMGCLKKLPVLTKKELRGNIDALTNRKLRLIKCNTGGSTGNPLMLYKDKRFNSISRGVQMRNHAVFTKWFPAEKSAWIWGAVHELDPLNEKLIEKLKWKLNNNIVLNAYAYSEESFKKWVKIIEKEKPSVIYGYASAISDFAGYLNKEKINIKGIVKKVITTAEALKNRGLIEQTFGAKVFDQYGCREVLPIAEECEYGTMHIAEDFVLIEVENDGRVLVTALESYGTPLIRYEIGDKIEIMDDCRCKCGSSFRGMRVKISRQPVNLKNREGKNISGCCTLLDIVSLDTGMEECQIVQESAGLIKLNIVRNSSWKEEHKYMIYDYLNKAFSGTKICFNFQDKITPEPSGKKIFVKNLC